MGVALSELAEQAKGLQGDVVALRRRIHAAPELGLDLPETCSAVREALSGLDLEIREGPKSSGFVASLRGARPGPRILLRADMDALPMPEDTGLPFASQHEGRMHACGHDAHTSMLVGAARLLDRHRAELAGTVDLMFQPGEEGYFGARAMLEDGLLDGDHAPDAAFAIHIDPRLPAGRVAGRGGALLAAADVFEIELVGRGGHGSMPHDTVDPVPVACEIVSALQTFVTRRVDAFQPVVLSVTQIHAGTTNNVIPESARIQGTLRSVAEGSRERAHAGIERIARQVGLAHEVDAQVTITAGYPVTVNDEGFAAFAREVSESVLGEGRFLDMPAPVMGAEDFSYLLQRVPGAMVFLGLRPDGVERPAPCHSNRMQIGEDGMAAGVALHTGIALSYLGSA